MIRGISLSRQWGASALYEYTRDHLGRQFVDGRLHPAVVLGIARAHGIPDLIGPAVEALANARLTFASWSTAPAIICHTSVVDVGAIGRMKEKLQSARITLCNIPNPLHDEGLCSPSSRPICTSSWNDYWVLNIVPKLLGINGEAVCPLLQIQREVTSTIRIKGMMEGCRSKTVVGSIAGRPGWEAEGNIVQGAVDLLMVPEGLMLTPDDVRFEMM